MKQLLATITAILMLTNAAFGQDTYNRVDSFLIKEKITIGSDTMRPPYFSFRELKLGNILFYNNPINTKILEIRPNGDIFYTPSSFCDCDKCKSFKGMRFLMNFIRN